MSHQALIAVPAPRQDASVVRTRDQGLSIPWTIWLLLTGMVLNLVSAMWDDTWHASIGADTYWPPPHVLMQLSPILPLIACTYALISATFSSPVRLRGDSVRVLLLQAPAGAFITLWGCIAILVGGPFDNWWHQAYGDAKIATPPHLLLLLGSLALHIGGIAWIATVMNRAQNELHHRMMWLFLFACSLGLEPFVSQIPNARGMHTADCYMSFAIAIPTWLVACGQGSSYKWGSTVVASFYTVKSLLAEWLLPLIPAQPKFGPVYHKVTHLIPSGFPPVILIPAVVADVLLWQRLGKQSRWVKAIIVGPALVLSFLVVQWPFANFLLSPASRNWFFGTAYFAYSDLAGLQYDPYKFDATEKFGAFVLTMAVAFVISILTTRLGLAWGEWMRRLRR